MANTPFVGGVTIGIGAAADTPATDTYTPIQKITGFSGLGKTNELIESTSFDSNGVKEYIGGLADGNEITIDASYLPGNVQHELIRTKVNTKVNGNIEVAVDDGTDTEAFQFNAVFLSWNFNPSFEDKNAVSFTLKISGDITIV